METREIPVVDRVEFERMSADDPHLVHKHPWIVTGHVQRWAGFGRWSDIKQLRQRFGHLTAYASAPHFATSKRQQMFSVETRYSQYLDYVEDPSRLADIYPGAWVKGNCEDFLRQTMPLYCGSIRMVHDGGNEILQELDPLVPRSIETWNHALPYYYALFNHFWLFVSLPGALTPLHRDNNGIMAILAQLKGHKRAILYSPEDLRHVYNDQVGYLDPLAPDRSDFPSWDAAVQWRGEIRDGQALFFGTDWSHHVETLETSISVGFDFVNETNIEAYAQSPQWAEGFGKRIKLNPSMYAERSKGFFSEADVQAMSSVELGRRFMAHVLRQAVQHAGLPGDEVSAIRQRYLTHLDALA